MPRADVVDALATRFGGEAFPLGVVVPEAALLEALRALRDTHGYRYYVTASATERDEHFEVLHVLRNLEHADDIVVKVATRGKDAPAVDSAAFVFAGAEWQERELLDLFGIEFRNHPDPRRLLMPDDYAGHPLRKDFPMDTPWGYRPPTAEEPA